MRIEAVTVSVGYGDFLAHTLPYNLPIFDDFLVITTKQDKETIGVCKRYGVKHVCTNQFYADDSPFNKARGINHGLAHCSRKDWLCHIDADIVLPLRSRWFLANARLRKDCVYGVDRVNCPSYEEWRDFNRNPEVQYEWSYLVKPPSRWPVGARIAHMDYGGYCPIGFFQLWHASETLRYPMVVDGDAEHSDLLHSLQWDRENRVLLPELFAIHLESESAPMGANWKGRKTKRFGPATGGVSNAASPSNHSADSPGYRPR